MAHTAPAKNWLVVFEARHAKGNPHQLLADGLRGQRRRDEPQQRLGLVGRGGLGGVDQ
jgi:hypothetical protein